jgi:hypothetical protein
MPRLPTSTETKRDRGSNFAGGLLLLAVQWLPLTAAAGDTPLAASGVQHDVVFADYSPLARSSELIQRRRCAGTANKNRCALRRSGRGA